MLRKGSIAVGLILSVLMIEACKKDSPDSAPCTVVDQILTADQCYSAFSGLPLTASGQSTLPGQYQFVWSFYAQSDTLAASANIDQVNERLLIGSENIVVPDSLLKNTSRFVISVMNSCERVQLHSKYFSFVKRQKVGTSCSIWVLQNP